MAKQKEIDAKLLEMEDKITQLSNKIDVLEQKIIAISDDTNSRIMELSKLLSVTEQDYYDLRKEVVEKIDIYTHKINQQVGAIKDNMISITNVVLKNYKSIESLKQEFENFKNPSKKKQLVKKG